MMPFDANFAGAEIIDRVGWVLIHSLWQFTLAAIVAWIALLRLTRSSSEVRENLLFGFLLTCAALPGMTWVRMSSQSERVAESIITPQIISSQFEQQSIKKSDPKRTAIAAKLPDVEVALAGTASAVEAEFQPAFNHSTEAVVTASRPRFNETFEPWLHWIVAAWGVGVIIASLRPLLGWYSLRRLRTIGVSVVSNDLIQSVNGLAARLGLRRRIELMGSTLAGVPMVVGYLRPVILLPISLLTNLPASQIEAILTHELAHIRRHDFLVNLLQVFGETVFFYHPAVWWLSHQLRIERENCCDDLVVKLLEDRVDYGRALVAIEQLRGQRTALALSVSDGSLLARIRRLTNPVQHQNRSSSGVSIGLLSLIIGSALLIGLSQQNPTSAIADESFQDEPLPFGASLRFGTALFRSGVPIDVLAVSPDEKFAVAVHDQQTRVFDLSTGKKLYDLPTSLEAAAITPDSRLILTKQNFKVLIRDAADGHEIRRIELPRVDSYSTNQWIEISPDGKFIAVTSQGNAIHLIHLETGNMLGEISNVVPDSELSSSFDTVLSAAFSPDGRYLASGGFNRKDEVYYARLWDTGTGQEVRRFQHAKNSHGIQSIACSPDSQTIATRSHDGRMRLFNVESSELLHEFDKDGGGRQLGTVAFSPDNKTVAAAGNAIRLYDVKSGAEKLVIDRMQASNLKFTDQGQTLTGVVMGAIYRWDATTGKSLTPEAGDSIIQQIVVSSNGKLVITRGQSGDVHVWDAAAGHHLRRIPEVVWQQEIAISPDGNFLVWADDDNSIKIPVPEENPRLIYSGSRIQVYNIAADHFEDRFPAFKGNAENLAFSPDGTELITIGHRDGVVRVWDFATGKEKRSFQAMTEEDVDQSRQVTQARLSPDGRILAIFPTPLEEHFVGERGQILEPLGKALPTPRPARLWDLQTGKLLHIFKDASGAVAFSPDGKLFVSSHRTVWDVATGDEVAKLGSTPYIRGLAFSPNGRFLAAAVAGDLIQIWEVGEWAKRIEIPGHRDLTTLTFTPDGRLLSGSRDTTVLTWDLQASQFAAKTNQETNRVAAEHAAKTIKESHLIPPAMTLNPPPLADANGIYWSDRIDDGWQAGMQVIDWPSAESSKLIVQPVLRNATDQQRNVDLSIHGRGPIRFTLTSGNDIALFLSGSWEEEHTAQPNEILSEEHWQTTVDFAALPPGSYTVDFGAVFFVPVEEQIGARSGISFRLKLPVEVVTGHAKPWRNDEFVQATPEGAYADLSIHWGEPVAGLRVGILFENGPAAGDSVFNQGEIAEARLFVQNVSAESMDCQMLLPHRMDGWGMNISDSEQHSIRRNQIYISGFSPQRSFAATLAPGEIQPMTGRLDRFREGNEDAGDVPEVDHVKFLIAAETPKAGEYRPPFTYGLPIGKYNLECFVRLRRDDLPNADISLETGSIPFRVRN